MTLQEKRQDWERGAEEILCVTNNIDNYKVVFVVLHGKSGYSLHRYFKIGGNWEVSVDISGETLEFCLEAITRGFEELHPNDGC